MIRAPALLGQIIEYVLGFFALTVFALLALGQGTPSSATWRTAFLVSAGLAVVELVLLYLRRTPTNRLILGANIWLIGGGLAFLSRQWWMLTIYERWGAAGLLGIIAITGLVATIATPSGFVAAHGPPRAIRLASIILLAATTAAFGYLIVVAGNDHARAALPLVCLAWLARFLRLWAGRQT